MKKSLIATLLGCFLAAPLFAQAESSYVSVTVGNSNYDHPGFDKSATGVGFAYGQSITDTVGYEVGYIHFGGVKPQPDAKLETQSLYLAGVGSYPLSEAFSVYGKLGATINRYSEETPLGNESRTKLRPMIGAGVGYKFTKEWSAGLEYVYFGEYSDLKMTMWSANLRYHF
jgi:opacity protein-like surface antigen